MGAFVTDALAYQKELGKAKTQSEIDLVNKEWIKKIHFHTNTSQQQQ